MPYSVRGASQFFYISLKISEKSRYLCSVKANFHTIGTRMHNVSLKCMAIYNFNFKIEVGGRLPSWK